MSNLKWKRNIHLPTPEYNRGSGGILTNILTRTQLEEIVGCASRQNASIILAGKVTDMHPQMKLQRGAE